MVAEKQVNAGHILYRRHYVGMLADMVLNQHRCPVVVPAGDGVIGDLAVQRGLYPGNQVVIPGIAAYIFPLDFAVELALFHAPSDAWNPVQFGNQIRIGNYIFLPCPHPFPVFPPDERVNGGSILVDQARRDVALPAPVVNAQFPGEFPQSAYRHGGEFAIGEVAPGYHDALRLPASFWNRAMYSCLKM